MDDVNQRPEELSDGKLNGSIAWLAERNRPEVTGFRREKLRRAFVAALNERMKADPTLASTSTVSVS